MESKYLTKDSNGCTLFSALGLVQEGLSEPDTAVSAKGSPSKLTEPIFRFFFSRFPSLSRTFHFQSGNFSLTLSFSFKTSNTVFKTNKTTTQRSLFASLSLSYAKLIYSFCRESNKKATSIVPRLPFLRFVFY
jgi:hypothetical protein